LSVYRRITLGVLRSKQPRGPFYKGSRNLGIVIVIGLFAAAQSCGYARAVTLAEIEAATEQLLPEQKEKLLLFLAEKLRAERGSLPPPREFSRETVQQWMDEDEET
jgi:hypothetical protein